MEALLDSICKFAADDSKWDEGHLKTATEKVAQGEGFNLDPRTLAMAALGAGGLAGGGALSGRLSGKQLALLALLGAAAGGGGHELYQYLQDDDQPAGGGEGGGMLDAITPGINPSLRGAIGSGLVGLGAGTGYGALRNVFSELSGQRGATIRSVLTAPDDAEAARRLRNFLERDAALRTRLGETGAQVPANPEIQEAARNLRTFAQQRGLDPNDPQSIRNVEQALRGGSMDIDYEGRPGDLPGDVRQQLETEQQLRTRLGDIEGELAERARTGQLLQRPDLRTGAINYRVADELMQDPDQLKTYERLRKQLGERQRILGQLPEGDTPDPLKARGRGRLNLLTGEVPELDVGGRTFENVKMPGAFDTMRAVRNRLSAGPGFQMRRFAPRLRGIGGAAAGGAGIGALLGGLLGND